MINLFFFIVLLSIFLIFNLFLKKTFFDPLVLHTGVWLFVFFVGLFNFDDFYPLESFFWYSWVVWFFSFSLGYYLINPKVNNRKKIYNYYSLPNYSLIIYIINVFFFVFTILEGLKGGFGFLLNLRLSFISNDDSPLRIFFTLFTFFWPLYLYEGVVFKKSANFISLFIFLLIYTIASGGKFGILMSISALLFILNFREKIKRIYLIIIFLFTILSFSLITFFRDQSETEFITYVFAPLIAFQSLEGFQSSIFGYETFRFFYSAFYELGISRIKPPEDFYEYIMTPIYVNVYTGMRPFYMDFGYLGVFFGGIFYGLFFSYLYNGYLNKKVFTSSLYFGFAFCVISIPFSDLLFLNLSLLLRTILISYFLYFVFNRNSIFLKND